MRRQSVTSPPPSETGATADARPCGHKPGGCENAATGTRDGLCSACFYDHCDHEEEMLSAAFANASAPVLSRMGTVYTDEQIEAIKAAAKRSAHLEDARAAMAEICEGPSDRFNQAAHSDAHDGCHAAFRIIAAIGGPEVWDSLTGGGR